MNLQFGVAGRDVGRFKFSVVLVVPQGCQFRVGRGQVVVASLDCFAGATGTAGSMFGAVGDVSPISVALVIDPPDLLVGPGRNHERRQIPVGVMVPFGAETGKNVTERVQARHNTLTGANGTVKCFARIPAGMSLGGALDVSVVAYQQQRPARCWSGDHVTVLPPPVVVSSGGTQAIHGSVERFHRISDGRQNEAGVGEERWFEGIHGSFTVKDAAHPHGRGPQEQPHLIAQFRGALRHPGLQHGGKPRVSIRERHRLVQHDCLHFGVDDGRQDSGNPREVSGTGYTVVLCPTGGPHSAYHLLDQPCGDPSLAVEISDLQIRLDDLRRYPMCSPLTRWVRRIGRRSFGRGTGGNPSVMC